MSEEQTERFEGGTLFERRVLMELANLKGEMGNLNNRLTTLEEKVDAWLPDTRPIWEAVLGRLDRIEAKLDVFNKDLVETRADVELLKKRPPAA